MIVHINKMTQGCFFEEIEKGEVFCSEVNPNNFLLRTDSTVWVAVDLVAGVLYHYEDFNHDVAQYHIVNAEVNIS